MTDNENLKRQAAAKIAADAQLRAAAELFVETVAKLKAGGDKALSYDHPIIRAMQMAVEWDGQIPDSNQAKRMVN